MIKVLVVDDSAVVRRVLSEALNAAEGIEVVGSAVDPYVAREKIASLKPDVLTLDIEMPRMDGLTFLEKLMAHHPMPVIVVSSLTPANSAMALRALELGAVGVVCKPGSQFSIPDVARDIVHQVRAAALAKIRPALPRKPRVLSPSDKSQSLVTTKKVLAIGASTGGPRAIEDVLSGLTASCPGTVVVQHFPEKLSKFYRSSESPRPRVWLAQANLGNRVARLFRPFLLEDSSRKRPAQFNRAWTNLQQPGWTFR